MSRKKIYRKRRLAPIATRDFINDLLVKMGGRPGKERLHLLWQNWDQVVGNTIEGKILSIATQGRTLIARVENAIHMQEMQFQAQDILHQINNFLGTDYFETVKFSIHQIGKKFPVENAKNHFKSSNPNVKKKIKKGKNPRLCGKYLKDMDKSSPVALCYAAFISS